MRNIAKATEIRVRRSELRRQIEKAGRDPYAILLGNDPAWVEIADRTKVRYWLEAIPGVGPVTADEAMLSVGVARDSKIRLGELTYDARGQLVAVLRDALGAPA